MAPLEKRSQAGTNRDPAGLRPPRSPRLIRAKSFANQGKTPRADPSRGKAASGTAAAGTGRDVAANFAKFIGYADDGR